MKFSVLALATMLGWALGLVVTEDPSQLEYLKTPETNHIFWAYAKIIPGLAAANIVTNAGALALKMGLDVPFVNSRDLSIPPLTMSSWQAFSWCCNTPPRVEEIGILPSTLHFQFTPSSGWLARPPSLTLPRT